MDNPQPITHNDRLVAIVIAGQAIIDDTLTEQDGQQAKAMCLYALEIQDGQRAGPYTDASAAQYAHHAATSREGDSQASNQWRDGRLLGLVEDINDQCQRVARNGPEPIYAGEKLEFALNQLARALVHTGMTPTEIRDTAADAARRELDWWSPSP